MRPGSFKRCITKALMRDDTCGLGFKEPNFKEVTVRRVKQHIHEKRGKTACYNDFNTITHLQPFIQQLKVKRCNSHNTDKGSWKWFNWTYWHSFTHFYTVWDEQAILLCGFIWSCWEAASLALLFVQQCDWWSLTRHCFCIVLSPRPLSARSVAPFSWKSRG